MLELGCEAHVDQGDVRYLVEEGLRGARLVTGSEVADAAPVERTDESRDAPCREPDPEPVDGREAMGLAERDGTRIGVHRAGDPGSLERDHRAGEGLGDALDELDATDDELSEFVHRWSLGLDDDVVG